MQHTRQPRAPALARKGVLSSQPLQHQQHPFPPNAAKHRTRSMHLGGERGRQRARDCSPASRIPRNPALALSLNLRPPACCPATRLPLKHSALSVLEYQILRKFWSSFFFSQHRSNCRFGVVKAKPGLRPWSQRERAHGYGHGASACAAAASRKCECGGHGATGARSVVFCSREQGLRVRSHSLQRCLGKGHHATRRAALRAQRAHLTA